MSKDMRIAITGTIGSGKTMACGHIRERGYEVFDCDAYNAYLLEDGNKGNQLVKEAFPDAFDDDKLNKKKLADIVFHNRRAKDKLESILHPLIVEGMLFESMKNELFFAEVPLLFECNMECLFDHNLLIVCDEKIALERLLERNISNEEAIDRINNQMDIKNKMLRADEIIYNNGTLQELYDSIDIWLEKYVR